jgi:hypothetical protein
MVDDEAGPKYTPDISKCLQLLYEHKVVLQNITCLRTHWEVHGSWRSFVRKVSSVIATCKLPNRVTYESNYEPR